MPVLKNLDLNNIVPGICNEKGNDRWFYRFLSKWNKWVKVGNIHFIALIDLWKQAKKVGLKSRGEKEA